jgi:hypothetical protein
VVRVASNGAAHGTPRPQVWAAPCAGSDENVASVPRHSPPIKWCPFNMIVSSKVSSAQLDYALGSGTKGPLRALRLEAHRVHELSQLWTGNRHHVSQLMGKSRTRSVAILCGGTSFLKLTHCNSLEFNH